MCAFSKPSIPAPPPPPVDERKKEADRKEKETKERLAKRKGGRQFLNRDRGFGGIGKTLLSGSANKLGSDVTKL